MIAQIRAELLKIRTTRTTIALILAMIVLFQVASGACGLYCSDGQNRSD